MSSSVRKAFRILQFLAEQPLPLNLTDISRELKWNKTTAFRYLETLERLDLVEKRDNLYRLGLALFVLGNRVPVKQALIQRIDPFMRKLCREVDETVNLAQLYGERALYLHKIESRHSLQMRADIGAELPLTCTALGKAILASLDEKMVRRLLDGQSLKPQTRFTITTRSRLLAEVDSVRRQGYSVDREEFEIGLSCVAVPLSIPGLDFLGALSVSAPSLRMNPGSEEAMAKRLKRMAQDIVPALGEGGEKTKHGPRGRRERE